MTGSRLHLPCALLVLLFVVPFASAQPPLLDDHDWRAPAAAAKAEGIEREVTPELLLKTELKEPVFLFDPTDDETITYITDFRGKLYLASCTQPADTATGSVFTYDPETNQWQKVFTVNDEGLVRLEVYGDRLYLPGYDANDGGWDLGNIYVHDGATWVEHRTVPRAIHEYGLAVYHDRIYLSADILDPPPAGMTLDEAAEKDLLAVHGRVLSSGDGGLTWREEYRGPQPGQDVGFVTVWHDRLILNAQGDLITFSGKRWQKLGLNPNALVVLDYTDAGDVLVLGTSLGLGFYDGKRFWRANDRLLQGCHVRAVTHFGTHWLLLNNYIAGGTLRHGPGGTGYMRVDRPYGTLLFAMEDKEFRLIVGQNATQQAWDQVLWIHVRTGDMGVSAHAFRGRLYLGTHPNGRVLVLPVVKEGTLDSTPHRIPQAGTYHLTWEAAAPEGTACRLQLRTAPTIAALDAAPFLGPDGAGTFFETSGAPLSLPAGYLQYRVTLTTDNPALTPYLKRVTMTQ
jgi:hypothetical protein